MPSPCAQISPCLIADPFRAASRRPPATFSFLLLLLLLALACAPAVGSRIEGGAGGAGGGGRTATEVGAAGAGMRGCTDEDLWVDMYGNAAMNCNAVGQAVRSGRTTCMAQPGRYESILHCCTKSAAETLLAHPNASVEHADCSLMKLDMHGLLGNKGVWTWYVRAEHQSRRSRDNGTRLKEEETRILALLTDEASMHVVREQRAPGGLRKRFNRYELPRANAEILDDPFADETRIDEEERAEFQNMAACMRGWKVTEIEPLGHGAFGSVYKGVPDGSSSTDTRPVAIKIFQLRPPRHDGRSEGLVTLPGFAREVAAQRIASDLGLAPKVRDFFACGQQGGNLLLGFIIMDLVQGRTLEKYLLDHHKEGLDNSILCDPNHVATTKSRGYITKSMYWSLYTALPKLDDYGLITADQHTGNILVSDKDNELFFIDFGLATGKSHEADWWKDEILESNFGCQHEH